MDAAASGDRFTNLPIDNNTVYKVSGPDGSAYGIATTGSSVTVTNNIVADALTNQLFGARGSLAAHDHNLFYSSTPAAAVGAYGSSNYTCLLYTSDAADDLLCVDLGGRR